MINSNIYDYVNVLDKAADASWMRQEAISNNIANVNTPGYKRQDVAFEDSLQEAISNSRYRSTDEKVANLSKADLRIRSYTDSGERSAVLPVRQAAAALEAMGLEGEELLLVYRDTGSDTVTAAWAAAGTSEVG